MPLLSYTPSLFLSPSPRKKKKTLYEINSPHILRDIIQIKAREMAEGDWLYYRGRVNGTKRSEASLHTVEHVFYTALELNNRIMACTFNPGHLDVMETIDWFCFFPLNASVERERTRFKLVLHYEIPPMSIPDFFDSLKNKDATTALSLRKSHYSSMKNRLLHLWKHETPQVTLTGGNRHLSGWYYTGNNTSRFVLVDTEDKSKAGLYDDHTTCIVTLCSVLCGRVTLDMDLDGAVDRLEKEERAATDEQYKALLGDAISLARKKKLS